MEAQKMGISLTPQEQFEVFSADYRGAEWAAEAEQWWGADRRVVAVQSTHVRLHERGLAAD
jgi:hypothetical protein